MKFTPSELNTLSASNSSFPFYTRFGDGEYAYVSGSIIIPTNADPKTTEPVGYLFMVRVLSPEFLTALGAMSNAQVVLDQPKPVFYPVTAEKVAVYYPLQDRTGDTIGQLRGEYGNPYMETFLRGQKANLTYFGLSILGLLSGFSLVIFFWVFKPIAKISAALRSGETGGIEDIRNRGGDFGQFAGMIVDYIHGRTKMTEQIELFKETEAQLVESRESYRTLTDISSDRTFIVDMDPEKGINFVQGKEQLERHAPDINMSMSNIDSIMKVIHPDDLQKIPHWLEDLKRGKMVVDEIKTIDSEHRIRWSSVRLLPRREEANPEVLRVFGAVTNVTDQKRHDQVYHTLVDNSDIGLAIVRARRLTFVNPAFARMVGNTPEELTALGTQDLAARIHPGSLGYWRSTLTALDEKEISAGNALVQVIHTDGSWRWLDFRLATLLDYRDELTFQLTAFDVTEKVQNAAAVDHLRQYANILFESASALIFVLNTEGLVVNANSSARAYLLERQLAVGVASIWDCFTVPDDAPISRESYLTTITRNRSAAGISLTSAGGDQIRYFEWSHSLIDNNDGSGVRVIGIAIELTDTIHRLHQQEAIAGIAATMRGNLSRSQTIAAILPVVKEYTHAHTISMATRISDTRELLIEQSIGEYGTYLEGMRVSQDQSVAINVFTTGKPYFSNDLVNENRFAFPSLSDRIGVAAWIPLHSEGEVVGLFFINRDERFSEEETVRFQPVADMAANAIERSARVDNAQKRIQQLSALQSINLAIDTSLDLRTTMRLLTEQMTSQLGVDAVVVYLRDPASNRLVAVADSGFHSNGEGLRFPELTGNATGLANEERQTSHLYDPGGLANHPGLPAIYREDNFVAYDGVPMVVKGEMKGFIEALHRDPYLPNLEWTRLLDALALETAIAIDNAEMVSKLKDTNIDLQKAYDSTIEGWARSLEEFGQEWGLQSDRVVDLTVGLAQWMGISGSLLTQIRYGALLHDVGKLGIPHGILEKPGSLTESEWDSVRLHPTIAHSILRNIPYLNAAMEIPYHHHERWDGNGYPDRLKGEQIPLSARIFSVTDVFDALTSDRPYRKAKSEEEALRIIAEGSGTQFEPRIVQAFLDFYSFYRHKNPSAGSEDPDLTPPAN